MIVRRLASRAVKVVETTRNTPDFCAAARCAEQAPTSASGCPPLVSQHVKRLHDSRIVHSSFRSGFIDPCADVIGVCPGKCEVLVSSRLLPILGWDLLPAVPGRNISALAKASRGSSDVQKLYSYRQHRHAFGLPNLNADASKKYQERRLIGYSQDQLFSVVASVEHYKEFVPWCQRSEVVQRKPPDFVEAELEVGFKMFVERYTSQVRLHKPGKVVSSVYDSTLFDHLDSTWEFKPGPVPNSTWLSFSVDFAFKSPLYHHIASVFFDEVVKRMMGAFESRCQQLYGKSAFTKGPTMEQKAKMQTA